MNYKFRYWDELFKRMIQIHLDNGNDWDGFHYKYEKHAYIEMARLDFESTFRYPYLKYTFSTPDGNAVIYTVNNKSTGGLETEIRGVHSVGGTVYDLTEPSEDAEEILKECYLFAVKQMSTIWYN